MLRPRSVWGGVTSGRRRFGGSKGLRIRRWLLTRSACGPSSTTLPWSRTTILSRLATVDRRCATTMQVRPRMSFDRASCTSASLSESRALVASSSTSTGQSASSARAMATRWRCPPESFTPRSPVMVSNPSRQVLDEIQCVCLGRGLANLLHGGVGATIGDVLGNGAVEQQRLLRHVGDGAAKALLRAFGDVLPVDEDAAVLDVGQAQQQLRERGFPCSAQADQTHSLTCGNMQVEILEHRAFSHCRRCSGSRCPSKSMAPSRTTMSGAPGRSATRRGSSRVCVMPLASPKARLKRCRPLLMKLNWFVTV